MLKYTLTTDSDCADDLRCALYHLCARFYGPGDPLEFQFGERMPTDPQAIERLRRAYGLDRPFLVQFGSIRGSCCRETWGVR
ncbi:hypothetical protein KFU94_14020 [Chloroflexi bacterium TSY]|nr:hypothetical protein [Chloroflexi bacterium TSY]